MAPKMFNGRVYSDRWRRPDPNSDPQGLQEDHGHNDNSSWIVVMLTTGIDYPSALPAARTLPKLWDKQHTGELIALDKVKSVPKFFIYWAWRPNTDAVLVPLPSMPWRPQAPGMMGSGL